MFVCVSGSDVATVENTLSTECWYPGICASQKILVRACNFGVSPVPGFSGLSAVEDVGLVLLFHPFALFVVVDYVEDPSASVHPLYLQKSIPPFHVNLAVIVEVKSCNAWIWSEVLVPLGRAGTRAERNCSQCEMCGDHTTQLEPTRK